MTTETKIPDALDHVRISLFDNATSTKPQKNISIHELLSLIKNPQDKIQEQIESLRQHLMKGDEEKYKHGKKKLVAVTVSGTFSRRKTADLLDHSGILQIDIDKVENPSMLRDKIAQDQHILSAFLSPSNQGVKALMFIPADHSVHKEVFMAADSYFKEHYNVQIDKSCKDVSRLMFLSYDPDLKTNPNAVPFELPEDNLLFDASDVTSIENSDCERAKVALEKISPEEYGTWINAGMALKDHLGQSGFPLWCSWSKSSSKYNQKEMQGKWDSFTGGNITAATLFYMASDTLKDSVDFTTNNGTKKKREYENSELLWPELVPLMREEEEPRPYPIDALGEVIKEAVIECKSFGKQPLAMISSAALATASIACQGHVDVARDSENIGPISLYFLTIAESGERKTGTDRIFSKPLEEWQRKVAKEMQNEIIESRAMLDAWKSERTALLSQIKQEKNKKLTKDYSTEKNVKISEGIKLSNRDRCDVPLAKTPQASSEDLLAFEPEKVI